MSDALLVGGLYAAFALAAIVAVVRAEGRRR